LIKEVHVKFRIDETDEVQEFLGKLLDRELEAAVVKVWKKVIDKKTVEELESRSIEIPVPSVFFSEDDSVVRIATEEDSGRDTSADEVY